jgi:hypothetical protein
LRQADCLAVGQLQRLHQRAIGHVGHQGGIGGLADKALGVHKIFVGGDRNYMSKCYIRHGLHRRQAKKRQLLARSILPSLGYDILPKFTPHLYIIA